MAGELADNAGRREGEAALPAKRQAGRTVVVLLGASPEPLALLARSFQALGVDMLETSDDPTAPGDWRRSWVCDVNRRMLEAIERPPGHVAHALPFPPGWWRRPAVQALKREAISRLEAALEGHDDLWGFADLATARLLPVWGDVFERLSVAPAYVWSLTAPAQAPSVTGAAPGEATAAAEVRWFAYGADIYRYGAEHLACVVDERDWRADPHQLVEALVEQLRLRWRGTRLDLYETIGAVLAQSLEVGTEPPLRRAAALPLSASFHRSALALGGDDEEARSRLTSIVESAELLRPLVAPFLPALEASPALVPAPEASPAAAPSPAGEDDPALLRQEIAALRESCAALKRAAQEAAVAAPPADPAPDEKADDERIARLQAELEARQAEIRWLHDRHAAEMREAEAELDELKRGSASQPALVQPPLDGARADELDAAQAEVARLQAEMVTLTNANERYLARIYELKKSLEDQGAFERAGR